MRLLVQLRLMRTDEGGRKFPISTGYRATWDNGDRLADGATHFHDAPIVALSVNPLPLGGEAEAEIQPLAPDLWPDLAPGAELHAYEGPRRVATAVFVRRST
jgi:hypothetical protein